MYHWSTTLNNCCVQYMTWYDLNCKLCVRRARGAPVTSHVLSLWQEKITFNHWILLNDKAHWLKGLTSYNEDFEITLYHYPKKVLYYEKGWVQYVAIEMSIHLPICLKLSNGAAVLKESFLMFSLGSSFLLQLQLPRKICLKECKLWSKIILIY